MTNVQSAESGTSPLHSSSPEEMIRMFVPVTDARSPRAVPRSESRSVVASSTPRAAPGSWRSARAVTAAQGISARTSIGR
ncbi:hypothetical protein JKP75_15480 [Blastococcus sp. TML/M2B]|nr:hypothetical protein [Blastococcus sp. TML/M2B]MBN1093831.1 hypothetical protein [Blastococcus sp. TML/M2B]